MLLLTTVMVHSRHNTEVVHFMVNREVSCKCPHLFQAPLFCQLLSDGKQLSLQMCPLLYDHIDVILTLPLDSHSPSPAITSRHSYA